MTSSKFYNIRQNSGENTTTFFSRKMSLFRQADLPEDALLLIVDRLIHGCLNKDSKKKLRIPDKDTTVEQCPDILKQQEAPEASLRIEDAESDVQVNASYVRDSTSQSQRIGARQPAQQFRPQHCQRSADTSVLRAR